MASICNELFRAFWAIDLAVAPQGVKLGAVAPKDECVNCLLVRGDRVVYVSGKTAHGCTVEQGVTTNKSLCNVVLVFYADNYQRVAVIKPFIFFTGEPSFSWRDDAC